MRDVPFDKKLTRDMIEAAGVVATETGAFWTDQLNNEDQLAAYYKMADEIWSQTEGRIDAFVQCVGTAASVRGNAKALRRHNEKIRIVAVEPDESAVLSGGRPALTRSTASARDSLSRSGVRTSPIRSNGFRRGTPQRWRFGWR
jgi:cysteine synthase